METPTIEWIPAAEAIERLGVNERTLRKWAVKAKLRRKRDEEGRACYHAEDVDRLAMVGDSSSDSEVARALPAPAVAPADATLTSGTQPSEHSPADPTEVPSPAQGRNEELAQHLADARARERRYLQEIQWLRGQVDRLQEAERELRLILLRNSQALAAIHTERVLGDHTVQTAVRRKPEQETDRSPSPTEDAERPWPWSPVRPDPAPAGRRRG